jgi:hypothetical protein
MVEDVAPEGEMGRVLQPIEVQVVTVEIRDTANNRLATCIAILAAQKCVYFSHPPSYNNGLSVVSSPSEGADI